MRHKKTALDGIKNRKKTALAGQFVSTHFQLCNFRELRTALSGIKNRKRPRYTALKTEKDRPS